MTCTQIFSKILNEVIFLCPDEASVIELQRSGKKGIAYLPEEIEILKEAEKKIGKEEYGKYLVTIHQMKTIFPATRVKDFKKEEAPADVNALIRTAHATENQHEASSVSTPEGQGSCVHIESSVEDAEATPEPPPTEIEGLILP